MPIHRKKEEGELTAAGQKFKPANDKDAPPSKGGKEKEEGKQSKDSSDKESKRKKKEDGEPGTLKEVLQFIKEVRIEFFKISWPELPQVVRETLSVLVLVAIITLMVLGFDWFLAHAIFGPLEHWARLHGGGVGPGQ